MILASAVASIGLLTMAAGGGGSPAPAHHSGSGFVNPWPGPDRTRPGQRGFGAFLKWQLGLGPDEPTPFPGVEGAEYVPDIAAPDLKLLADPDPGAVQITWIGHSTVLVQMAGLNILTDPVFGERASPVGFAGPSRRSPPGVAFGDLPPIDLVLISHDHYDHLDKPTVKRLGAGPRYLAPLGLEKWFRGLGIQAREMDWWQKAEVGPLEVWCVPARHFSGRSPFRRNRTLWCGWLMRAKGLTVCFAGDTGFSPHFQGIRELFGPVDAAILPVGAYRPRWFMEPVHLDPPQAVKAHAALGARLSVPVHWGTFRQSAEPLGEPPLYLRACMEAAGLDPAAFRALRFGQTVVVRPAGIGKAD